MIDTHSHIYAEEFDTDLDEVIQRAKDSGLTHLIMPNVDSKSLPRMLSVEARHPDFCSSAIGLHPTSVGACYQSELDLIKSELERRKYIAIGEIGLDLYWDKTNLKEQIHCFQTQLQWALDYQLPVIIHVRDAFNETMTALKPFRNKGLVGIFHSFTGTIEQASEILAFGGFKLGINGIVTFKNSDLAEVLADISIINLVLETDSPYLSPVPHRGKRNESSYLMLIAEKVSKIYSLHRDEVMIICVENSRNIFNIR